MNYSEIEKLIASLQMRADDHDRPLWEIALQLAKINEVLDRVDLSVQGIQPGGNPQ